MRNSTRNPLGPNIIRFKNRATSCNHISLNWDEAPDLLHSVLFCAASFMGVSRTCGMHALETTCATFVEYWSTGVLE
jgi:hypothetical protein